MTVLGGPMPSYPHCPSCGELSELIIDADQALCTNDEGCLVLLFDPSLPDGGISNGVHVIGGIEGPVHGPAPVDEPE